MIGNDGLAMLKSFRVWNGSIIYDVQDDILGSKLSQLEVYSWSNPVKTNVMPLNNSPIIFFSRGFLFSQTLGSTYRFFRFLGVSVSSLSRVGVTTALFLFSSHSTSIRIINEVHWMKIFPFHLKRCRFQSATLQMERKDFHQCSSLTHLRFLFDPMNLCHQCTFAFHWLWISWPRSHFPHWIQTYSLQYHSWYSVPHLLFLLWLSGNWRMDVAITSWDSIWCRACNALNDVRMPFVSLHHLPILWSW